MTLWAFILSVIYVPGIVGGSIPTGWVLLSLTLPLMIWRGPALAWPLQAIGLAAITFAVASLAWASTPQFAIYGLWQQFTLALCFILGAKLASLDGAMRGFALGFAVSSAICVVQWLGWQPVEQLNPPQPAGLFFNPSNAGAAFAIAILWLVARSAWYFIPALIPGLFINGTRTPWAILAGATLLFLARKHCAIALALLPLSVAAAWYIANPWGQDIIRTDLWAVILRHLEPFGHGPGILQYVLLRVNGAMVRPEYAHNEYLDFITQYGIGAIPIFALALAPLWLGRHRPEWLPYVGFLVLAIWGYPLHSPPLAALGVLLAGHLCRDWDVAWTFSLRRRLAFHQRLASSRPGRTDPSGTGLSLSTNHHLQSYRS